MGVFTVGAYTNLSFPNIGSGHDRAIVLYFTNIAGGVRYIIGI